MSWTSTQMTSWRSWNGTMGTAGARGETGEGGRGTSLRVTYSPPAAPPHLPTLASNNSVCLHLQLKTPIITATEMVSTCQFPTELNHNCRYPIGCVVGKCTCWEGANVYNQNQLCTRSAPVCTNSHTTYNNKVEVGIVNNIPTKGGLKWRLYVSACVAD